MQSQPSKQQSTVCVHISKLSRKTLQQILEKAYRSNCSMCNKDLADAEQRDNPYFRVCLGCGGLVCSEFCCSSHLKEHPSHIFSIAIGEHLIKPGEIQSYPNRQSLSIYCSLCGNTLISDCADSVDSQPTASLSKLSRFRSYIETEIFPQLICTLSDGLQPEEGGSVCGLTNLGNSCFLNVVLQSLNTLQEFRDSYLNIKWGQSAAQNFAIICNDKAQKRQRELFYDALLDDHQNSQWTVVVDRKTKKMNRVSAIRSKAISNTHLNESLTQFFAQMQQSADQVEPIGILTEISAIDAKYACKGQQDAEQLLILLLDSLSQGEMLRVNEKSRYEQIERLLGRQKYTMTQNIFGSYLCSRVTCVGCSSESWAMDFTYHFPVPLTSAQKPEEHCSTRNPIEGIQYHEPLFYPQTESKSEVGILQPLFRTEKLTNTENYYECANCSASEGFKKLYLVSAPNVLIVSLKRFEKNGKIPSHVPFEEFICIDSICLEGESEREVSKHNGKKRYRLSSVIVHHGDSVHSGHYFSLIRRGGIWLRCSDESVRRVSWKQVKSSQAYILFYEKIQ